MLKSLSISTLLHVHFFCFAGYKFDDEEKAKVSEAKKIQKWVSLLNDPNICPEILCDWKFIYSVGSLSNYDDDDDDSFKKQ